PGVQGFADRPLPMDGQGSATQVLPDSQLDLFDAESAPAAPRFRLAGRDDGNRGDRSPEWHGSDVAPSPKRVRYRVLDSPAVPDSAGPTAHYFIVYRPPISAQSIERGGDIDLVLPFDPNGYGIRG